MYVLEHPEVRDLPVSGIARRVCEALDGQGACVVTAPPGAGKSTVLPLAIMERMEGGRILMLEPRRIAARSVAERMAELLGESPGGTVGYRVRFDSCVSARTRIEVITEGILTRMIAEDPTLDGVGTLIFDEFHERSIHADTALALALESRATLREDLRILVMSATIDAEDICRHIAAPLVQSPGRMFPVDTVYSHHDATPEDAAESVARLVREVLATREGDILAFLPGEGDIRRCSEMLGAGPDGGTIASGIGAVRVLPLYGRLSFERQRLATARGGGRKVVLATPVAETSLTIEGVRTVIDSGFCRKLVTDPFTGLERLETVRISLDMADQRRGRAGRVAPGVCYRLWCRGTESRMAARRTPEILEADLAPTVLDIAAWGGGAPSRLRWLTPPPAARLERAAELLGLLGALDNRGAITPAGRAMASLPCHPRISRMLLEGDTSLAADVAAILEEKDPLPEAGTDICLRIDALRRNPASLSRIAQTSSQYRNIASRLATSPVATPTDGQFHRSRDTQPADGQFHRSPVTQPAGAADPFEVGALLASAFPERIARSRGGGHFLLASGDAVWADPGDPVSACDWIVAASCGIRKGGEGRIRLAAVLSPAFLLEKERLRAEPGADTTFIKQRDNISWDARGGELVCRHEWNVGVLQLRSVPIQNPDRDACIGVICKAARSHGESMFDFASVAGEQRRIAAVASWHPELALPDVSTAAMLQRSQEWLPAFIENARTTAALRRIDLAGALWSLLSWEQRREVDRLAPTHLTVPTGSSIALEYRQGAEAPVLRVRLQECFGLTETPRVDGGRLPVLMELLSPGYKPVQLTSDLASFWAGAYFEVRKELRRRYPKHSWPDDPLEAEPTRRTVRK